MKSSFDRTYEKIKNEISNNMIDESVVGKIGDTFNKIGNAIHRVGHLWSTSSKNDIIKAFRNKFKSLFIGNDFKAADASGLSFIGQVEGIWEKFVYSPRDNKLKLFTSSSKNSFDLYPDNEKDVSLNLSQESLIELISEMCSDINQPDPLFSSCDMLDKPKVTRLS